MVLSHGNHGNFSKKLTCFLNPKQKEKPKCQDFSEKYSRSEKKNMLPFSLSLTQIFLTKGGMHKNRFREQYRSIPILFPVLFEPKAFHFTPSTLYPALRSSWSTPRSPGKWPAPTTKSVGRAAMTAGISFIQLALRS